MSIPPGPDAPGLTPLDLGFTMTEWKSEDGTEKATILNIDTPIGKFHFWLDPAVQMQLGRALIENASGISLAPAGSI